MTEATRPDAGRVAIVTGAAGGMGEAIAHEFARLGHRLVLSDLHVAPLKALALTLRATSGVRPRSARAARASCRCLRA